MIKGLGSRHGKPVLIIGLSGENLTRLMAREPILMDAADLGLPPLQILIVAGRTEEDIAADLGQARLYVKTPPSTSAEGS